MTTASPEELALAKHLFRAYMDERAVADPGIWWDSLSEEDQGCWIGVAREAMRCGASAHVGGLEGGAESGRGAGGTG